MIISGHESRLSGKYPISYCGEIEIHEAHWLLNKKITFPISARGVVVTAERNSTACRLNLHRCMSVERHYETVIIFA